MKKNKKNLIVFALLLLLSCVLWVNGDTIYAEASSVEDDQDSTQKYEDFSYVVREDGTVEITRYFGEAAEIKIPSEIAGKNVTSIGESAFYECTSLVSVEIPDSVTSIGWGAFGSCNSLESITIPDSVTSIGAVAFNMCSNLDSINVDSGNKRYDSRENCNAIIEKSSNTLIVGCKNTRIPNGVKSIGNDAFYGRSGLTSIEIPGSVTSIGGNAFSACGSLTNIKIPSGVKSIGDGAFFGCSNLKSIEISDSVTSIVNAAFAYCSSLSNITVDSDNTVYDSRENCNAIIEKSSNTLIVGCENTKIPEGIKIIGYNAFSGRSGLTSIEIPDSVESIEDYAFIYCSSLTSVKMSDSMKNIGLSAFNGCSNLTNIELPDSVTSIGMSAFFGCSGLTSIEISNGVTSIEWGTFLGCTGLTSIKIPNSVTNIGDSAFSGCWGLTSIEIPDSVASIGDEAFHYCIYLTSVIIPNGEMSIGDSAFDLCPATMVIYTVKDSKVEKWAKENGYTVKLLDEDTTGTPSTPQNPNNPNPGTPNTEAPITGDKDQSGETGSESTLPKIGTQKTISSGIYKITASSSKSKTVTFVKPKSNNKTSFTIPATVKIDGQTYKVTEVAAKVFKNNKKLKSVTIGKNVKKIGKEAFSGCKKLNKITIKSTVLKSVGKNAIKNINAKATIKCPKKQLAVYKKLFKSNTGYKKGMKIKK